MTSFNYTQIWIDKLRFELAGADNSGLATDFGSHPLGNLDQSRRVIFLNTLDAFNSVILVCATTSVFSFIIHRKGKMWGKIQELSS